MHPEDREFTFQLNPPPYPPVTTRETVFITTNQDVSVHEFEFERQRAATRYDTTIPFQQDQVSSGAFEEDEVSDADIVYGHGVLEAEAAGTREFEFRTRNAGVLKHALARHCHASIDGLEVANGFRELNVNVERDEPISITVRNPTIIRPRVAMFSLHVEYLSNTFDRIEETIEIN